MISNFTTGSFQTSQQQTLRIYNVNSWRSISGFTHGFTTRTGGISSKAFSSLNLGRNVGDIPSNVEANWRMLFETFGIPSNRWLTVHQVHGSNIIHVTDAVIANKLIEHVTEADGIITSLNGYVSSVQTADCVPILFVSPEIKIAGAVHAGWKGTVSGICTNAVNMVKEKYGLPPSKLYAAIGPSIGPCCFEVSRDVARQFPETCVKKSDSRETVNLWKANSLQLEEAGLPKENIHTADLCTSCNKELFFSHRRDNGRTGRMIAWAGWTDIKLS